jgi:hypothetical protein
MQAINAYDFELNERFDRRRGLRLGVKKVTRNIGSYKSCLRIPLFGGGNFTPFFDINGNE